MPTLHWIGKDKVINHHMDVPFKVLEHSYGFDNGTQTEQATNSGNKIIHGDNLEALKALLPEYEGKVKCIYIDPPYNTGNESWVYNDNVNDPKIKKWLGQVVGKEAEDLTRHDKWLCMMYPRLKLLHKLLADDGAIFISIADNEQANLKLICDEIFGSGNFVSECIVQSNSAKNNANYISVTHEYMFIYSRKIGMVEKNWKVKKSNVDEFVKRTNKLLSNKLEENEIKKSCDT
jgi:adenine-specific DNA-methyltransferase